MVSLIIILIGAARNVTASGAVAVIEIVANGGAEITDCGILWGTSESKLNYKSSFGNIGSGKGEYDCELQKLPPDKTIYYKAYAKNKNGTAYGSVKKFTTDGADRKAALKAFLEKNGVDTSCLRRVRKMQGHTVIQVNPAGENSILLFGGSNRCVTRKHVRETLACFREGDYLVLQNEINELPAIVDLAAERGMRIVLNPSPWNSALDAVDFGKLSWLFVNEIEMEQITGQTDPERAWDALHSRYPNLSALITLGSRGSVAFRVTADGVETARQEAIRVRAVDTTAAGDTYTGYFVAGQVAGLPLKQCMERAAKAAAISVTRPGAADSIPRACDVEGASL